MSTSAIKIQGRSGRNEFINGTYEPTTMQHNGRGVWLNQTPECSLYIFHTGKSRWVVGKKLDNGARCYCFVKDPGSIQDPVACKQAVIFCDNDGSWRPDGKCSMVYALSGTDKFQKLRQILDAEMQKYRLNDKPALQTLWKRVDTNGNGLVSLAEVDQLIQDMVKSGSWPNWLNNKPVLLRAFKKTLEEDKEDGNTDVHKKDFNALLLNIFWFNKLWQMFDVIDGSDRKIDPQEFQKGLSHLGLTLSPTEAMEEFRIMDVDRSGEVNFDEFCNFMRMRVTPDHDSNFDDADNATHAVAMRGLGDTACHTSYVAPKTFRDFDELENTIKEAASTKEGIKRIWRAIDYNGNNLVSLAEIDKWVVENHPLLNHKPALMRCYKNTLVDSKKGSKDGFVRKPDFKRMMVNLFYYNKLYWVFAEANEGDDNDRRMDFNEFRRCLSICHVELSEAEMEEEWKELDANGGGWVLFDEFCHYFASKSCPQGMTDFTDDGFDRTHGDGTEAVLKHAQIKGKETGVLPCYKSTFKDRFNGRRRH
eukprot:TRINITY_DN16598_c0_g1_i2.p1 TRINITY_DN16598_c0_g1~~TRINITY_DN16598_c0_g1_i2.p1  ORF type:complete len:533 (+),score=178.63 TRINITY_DN16598_c0_g1_i2:111-1709(+)